MNLQFLLKPFLLCVLEEMEHLSQTVSLDRLCCFDNLKLLFSLSDGMAAVAVHWPPCFFSKHAK